MSSRGWAALLVVVVAGAWLRFTALGFGLPDRLRPDEEHIVEGAAHLGGAAGWDPRFASYPAAQIYLVRGVAGLVQALQGRRWASDTPDGFTRWYLTGRIVSAVLGTLTIALGAAFAAAIVREGGDVANTSRAAVTAAALVAGSFLHARDSHFATTDVPVTFWTTLAWLAIARRARRGRRADSLLAGALVGLATATKYPAITLLVPLLLVHLEGRAADDAHDPAGRALRAGRAATGRTLDLVLALVALAGTFAAASPYVLLDLASTRAAIADLGPVLTTETFAYGTGSLAWLLTFACPTAVGWGLTAAALLAVLASAWRGGRIERLVVVWLVVAALPLVWAHLVFLRYVLPLLPVTLALIAAWTARLAQRAPRLAWLAAAAVLLLVAPSARRAIAFDRLVGRTDTRTLARVWMERNLPRGTIVHTPTFLVTFPYLLPVALRGEFSYAATERADLPGLTAGSYVLVATQPFRPSLLENELGRSADVLFDFTPADSSAGGRGVPVYEAADAFFVPLDGFAALDRPGPRVTLYRLRAAPRGGQPASTVKR